MCINVHIMYIFIRKCAKMLSKCTKMLSKCTFLHIKIRGFKKEGNVLRCTLIYILRFPSAFCYPFHFTWFLLLLSVPRCHSLEHFAMDLATFQHILEERGLQSIAVRAQQHHADKWLSLLCTEDKQAEFKQMIDLAIQVPSMRAIFSCDDVMMSAFLEAESQQQTLKSQQRIVGKGQDE